METKAKILIIDDEKEFTDLLQMNLRRHGRVHLRVINDSLKALDVAKEFWPDVILLDIVMPGKDGGEILRDLENDPLLRNIPVIVVSALVSNNDMQGDGHPHTGGHPVVAKPLNVDRLVEEIETIVGHPLKAH